MVSVGRLVQNIPLKGMIIRIILTEFLFLEARGITVDGKILAEGM